VVGYQGVINFLPILLSIENNIVSFTEGSYSKDVDRYELVLSNGTVYDLGSSGNEGNTYYIDVSRNKTEEDWKGDELSMIAVGYDSNDNVVIESEQTYLTMYGDYDQELKSVVTTNGYDSEDGSFITTGKFLFGPSSGRSYYSWGSSYFDKKPSVDLIRLGYFPIIGDSISKTQVNKLVKFLEQREPEDAFTPISTTIDGIKIDSNAISIPNAVTQSENGSYSPQTVNYGYLESIMSETLNPSVDEITVISVMQVRNTDNTYAAIYNDQIVNTRAFSLICQNNNLTCTNGLFSTGTILINSYSTMEECNAERLIYQTINQTACDPSTTTTTSTTTTPTSTATPTTATPTTTTTSAPTTPRPDVTTTAYPKPDWPEYFPDPEDLPEFCPFVTSEEFRNYNIFNPINTLQNLVVYFNGRIIQPYGNRNYPQIGSASHLSHFPNHNYTGTELGASTGYTSVFDYVFSSDEISFESDVTERVHPVVLSVVMTTDNFNPFDVQEISSFNVDTHDQVYAYSNSPRGTESAEYQASFGRRDFDHGLEMYTRLIPSARQYRFDRRAYKFAIPTAIREGVLIYDAQDPDFTYDILTFHTENGWFASQENAQYIYIWAGNDIDPTQIELAEQIDQSYLNPQYPNGLRVASAYFDHCADLTTFTLNGQQGIGIGYKTTIGNNYSIEAKLSYRPDYRKDLISTPLPQRQAWSSNVEGKPHPARSFSDHYELKYSQRELNSFIDITSRSVNMGIHEVGCFLGDINLEFDQGGDKIEILINKARQVNEEQNQETTYPSFDGNLFRPYGGWIYWHPANLTFNQNKGEVNFNYKPANSCWDSTYNSNIWFRSVRYEENLPAGGCKYSQRFPSLRLWGNLSQTKQTTIGGFLSVKGIEPYNRNEGLERRDGTKWYPQRDRDAKSLSNRNNLYLYTLTDDSFFVWTGSIPHSIPTNYVYPKGVENSDLYTTPTRMKENLYFPGDLILIEAKSRKVFKGDDIYFHDYSADGSNPSIASPDKPFIARNYPYSEAADSCFGGDKDANYNHYIAWRLKE